MKRKTNHAAAVTGVHPDDLLLFVRVIESGSLSAVARERNVPVSNVSRAVDRVEGVYQVRLLNRSTHGLSVTPEGELLMGHAREVLARLEDAAAELASRSTRPSGLVRLSVSQVMASRLVLPQLPPLIERFPELRIEIQAEDRLVDLATEGIDLAVRTSHVLNELLVARQIGEFRRVLFAAPAYLERFGTPSHPDELHRHRCITHTSSGSLNRWRFRIDRRVHEVAVNGYFRTSNTDLSLQMVTTGLGIGQINTALLGDLVKRGALVPVLEKYADPRRIPVHVVMLPDRNRLPKIRVVIDHLQKLMANV